MTPLALLILLSHTLQPCLGQADGRSAKTTAHNTEAKYDAPENDMRLINSECGFRINATRKVMPEFPVEARRAVKQLKWRKLRSGGIDRPVLGKLSFDFVIEGEAGRVEVGANDCDTSRVNWSLSDTQALRLRATWRMTARQTSPNYLGLAKPHLTPFCGRLNLLIISPCNRMTGLVG